MCCILDIIPFSKRIHCNLVGIRTVITALPVFIVVYAVLQVNAIGMFALPAAWFLLLLQCSVDDQER
jgi:hypothetical protein